MAKGGSYEREVCRELSLWFSGGHSDDWFWRASQSGGRATVRARKGKTTTGHCGDIAATCQEGERLTRLITFEVKRGYNKHPGPTVADLLDVLPHYGQQTFEAFIEQADDAAARAGTPYWMLIHRRDGRGPVAFFDQELYDRVVCRRPGPTVFFDAKINRPGDRKRKIAARQPLHVAAVGMPLSGFFKAVDPEDVLKLSRSLGEGKRK